MKKTYLYAAAAIVMWSTMPTISKVLLNEMDNYKVLCVSTLFATVTMLIINLCSKKWSLMKQYRFIDYVKMCLIGLPGVCLYYIFYYGGTTKLPASQAFIINYLWPIMSIVFACFILKEKITARKMIAIVMSFLGVITVTGEDLFQFNTDTVFGMFLCLCAAICYGFYTAINKKSSYDKQISMTMAMLTAFVPSLVIVIVKGESLLLSPLQIPGILWNGIFTMALANLAWVLALSHGNTSKISNLAYITPFLSLVWTFFILGESIRITSLLGLCLIVVGIFIQIKDGKTSSTEQ